MFKITEERNREHVYDLKGNAYVYWGENLRGIFMSINISEAK